jgi:hypothetical protein
MTTTVITDPNACTTVIAALLDTDHAYMDSTIAMRNQGPEAAGSTWNERQGFSDLMMADWTEANDPNVMATARAYRAPIAGKVKAVSIETLPMDTPVRFVAAHNGEGPGMKVQANLGDGLAVDFTTLILGPYGDGTTTVVYTVHPGPAMPRNPVVSSDLIAEICPEGVGTVADALLFGFRTVKHTDSL